MLQLCKRSLLGNIPDPRLILLQQKIQRRSHVSKMAHKLRIVVAHAQEHLQLFHRSGRNTIINRTRLGRVHSNAISRNHVPKVLQLPQTKCTLTSLRHQLMPAQLVKHPAQVLLVGVGIRGEYEYII